MNFPEEVLRLIFNHCDPATLQNCLLVSRNVRELIIKTPKIMEKLPVIFFRNNWRSKVPFVEKYGKQVRSVIFDWCPFEFCTNEIKEILLQTPNLVKLRAFTEAYYDDNYNEDQEDQSTIKNNGIELNLKALREININGSEIFTKRLMHDLRRCHAIKKFVVSIFFHVPVIEVGRFLAEQKCLEELHVLGSWGGPEAVTSVFINEMITKTDLKLKTLVLESGSSYHQGLSDFLRAQANNIEELRLAGSCISYDFHYYRLIFQCFKNLKRISFKVNYKFNQMRIDEIANYRLPSVTEFSCGEEIHDLHVFKTLMEMFPNLEVLIVPIVNFPLFKVLKNLPKLKTIKSNRFKLELMLFAKVPSLKELEVSIQEPTFLSFYWKQLAHDCPNIERLVIKDIGSSLIQSAIVEELDIILRCLPKFQCLKYCEIIIENTSTPLLTSDDHDNPDDNTITRFPTFKFFLQKRFDGDFSLKVSNLDNRRLKLRLEKLREDLNVSDFIDI